MRGPLISALVAFGLFSQAVAAPHRLHVYPNSLSILSIAEGPDGLLWLAADDGLYRFDGFHYQKITAFPFASARFVAFTADGSLWAADYQGLVRARNGRFETLLTEDVSGMAAYPNQVFVRLLDGLARIGLDGSVERLKIPALRDLTIDSSGRLWFICMRTDLACSLDPAHPLQLQSGPQLPGSLFHEVARDPQERIWAADLEHAILIENGKPTLRLQRQSTQHTTRPGPLLPGRNGQLWFLGETIHGLTPPIEFRDRADDDRFPLLSGLQDSRGHLWVSSLGQGLVEWIQDPEWQRWFPEDFRKQAPVQVAPDSQGAMIVATRSNLFRQDGGNWSPLATQDLRYYAILPLEDGSVLASIRDFGLARISPQGRVLERLKDLDPQEQYREILRDAKGRIWVGSRRALLRVEGRLGALRLRSEDLPQVRPRELAQAVDLALDPAGRLWVGYEHGLAWLDDQDRWHPLATDQPVNAVRSFALAGDDIWVGHRRAGAFSRLHRRGRRWIVTAFSAQDYPPADTQFLRRDSRGWIWRGSSQGVHVSDGVHVAPADWLHLRLGNGLASNESGQYGFFEDSQRQVWIAGDEGLTRLHPDPSWFDAPRDAPPPQITRLEADGRVFLFPAPLPAALPAVTKVLRIDLGTLRASPFRDQPLRYRLLPLSRQWQLSRNGSLEFRNLSEPAYSLQVGYAGNGPSPVATYDFRVGSPRPAFPWRWFGAVLLALALLAALIRYLPIFDRLRFRIEKALFLARRRFSHRRLHSPAGAHPAAPDYSGETLLGRYHLDRVVSRGGFSVVYEAGDLRDGSSRLAVKVLNRSKGQEGWVRDRFAHEVAALRSVQHPSVVPILDSWVSAAGEPCLAMPFLDGQTLRAALAAAPLSHARVARIVRQLGGALAEIHGRGIVHRDLKPENLILLAPATSRESVVIIDFGTAGLRSAEDELAATTLMSGSFHYMAPERLTGHYSPASDLFSLAVIILEMLTGIRLSGLNAMFSDPSFHAELEQALCAARPAEEARILADLLAPAFNPDPKRRPAAVQAWTGEIAGALEESVNSRKL